MLLKDILRMSSEVEVRKHKHRFAVLMFPALEQLLCIGKVSSTGGFPYWKGRLKLEVITV